MKGGHCETCMKNCPDCCCNTCAKDNCGRPVEVACCIAHSKHCGEGCPDYVKEDETDD